MKLAGYTLPLVLFLILLTGGCIHQSSPSVQAYPVTTTIVPTTIPATPVPCITCNQTSRTTPVPVNVSPTIPFGGNSGQVPVADFVANRTSGRSPLAIGFFDRSSLSPANWSWDFGDGNQSYERNPVHVYLIPGTYSVGLNASNEAGSNTIAKIYYISVLPEFQAPIAAFGLNFQDSPSGIFRFVDQSDGPPTNWSWDFGDGKTSNLQNPVHIFSFPGNYMVSLTVSNPLGSSTAAREIVFGASP